MARSIPRPRGPDSSDPRPARRGRARLAAPCLAPTPLLAAVRAPLPLATRPATPPPAAPATTTPAAAPTSAPMVAPVQPPVVTAVTNDWLTVETAHLTIRVAPNDAVDAE